MLENYNSLAAMSLNAVTQTNVPQPFSPVIDVNNTPRLNMPESSSNMPENKFTASDLQETLHPSGGTNQEMSKTNSRVNVQLLIVRSDECGLWNPEER